MTDVTWGLSANQISPHSGPILSNGLFAFTDPDSNSDPNSAFGNWD